MKQRHEIKGDARNQIRGNIGKVGLVWIAWFGILMTAMLAITFTLGRQLFLALENFVYTADYETVLAEVARTSILYSIVTTAVSVVISAMMAWGMAANNNRMFRGEKADFKTGFAGINNFWRAFWVYFMQSLFLILWALIPVVGIVIAIIKSYSYANAIFIAQDDPNIGAIDAITKSREIMHGKKMDLFVQDLSFILWLIGGIFTLGFLFIYVAPYFSQSRYIFYQEAKSVATISQT